MNHKILIILFVLITSCTVNQLPITNYSGMELQYYGGSISNNSYKDQFEKAEYAFNVKI